jgi:probable HAF family extracellular repeat protein
MSTRRQAIAIVALPERILRPGGMFMDTDSQTSEIRSKRYRRAVFIAVVIFASVTPSLGQSQAKGKWTEFSVPGAQITGALGINFSREVVGYYFNTGAEHSFVRSPLGKITSFDPPLPIRVNINGEAVGYYKTGTRKTRGFLRNKQGKVTSLRFPGSRSTVALGINDDGQTTGYYTGRDFSPWHGFLRGAGGPFISFDAPGAGTGRDQGTFPVSVNVNRKIAGDYIDENMVYHGFMRDSNGTTITFDAPGAGSSGGQGTFSAGINGRSQIAGYYIDKGGVLHGFVRQANGQVKSFDPKGSTQTISTGINRGGQIAGRYIDTQGVEHVFSRSSSGRISSLDAPDSGKTAGHGTYAEDINDSGQITGSYIDANGQQHAFIYEPD